MLPAYIEENVDLSAAEHEGVKPLYEAVRKSQAAIADGFQPSDLLQVPEIAAQARKSIEWIVRGEAGDPSDDHAIADRMTATGFALVRASQVLRDLRKKEES